MMRVSGKFDTSLGKIQRESEREKKKRERHVKTNLERAKKKRASPLKTRVEELDESSSSSQEM